MPPRVRPVQRTKRQLALAAAAAAPPAHPREWRRGLMVRDTQLGDVLCRRPSLAQARRALAGGERHHLGVPSAAARAGGQR